MAIIKMHGAPNEHTRGEIGDKYIDLDTGMVYDCVGVKADKKVLDDYIAIYTRGTKDTIYTWESAGGGGGYVWDGNFVRDASYCVTIGDYFFRNNDLLKSVDLKKCDSIGRESFAITRNLESFICYNRSGNINIGDMAFNSSGVRTVSIVSSGPDGSSDGITFGVVTIGSSAFSYCSNLEEIYFNADVILSNDCFSYCTNLKKVEFTNLSKVPRSAFYRCENLELIDLKAAAYIDEGAFGKCDKLYAIIIRDGVCDINITAVLDSNIMTDEGIPTMRGFIYYEGESESSYRNKYEPIFEGLGAPGLFDVLFRKLEDYTVDGTTTGQLDESKI
jgi:hypothetical protein